MKVTYTPRGVCSKQMTVEAQDGVITSVQVVGGCDGNLKGIMSLLEGMPVEQAISKLEGIRCGMRATSCPDQLAKALRKLGEEN